MVRPNLLIAIVCLFAGIASLFASTKIEDEFSGGTPGSPISGHSVESGDATWRGVIDSPIFAESEGKSFATPGKNDPKSYAFVDVPAGLKQVTLSARVNPAGSDWAALGLGAGDAPFFQTGGVWVLLRPDGRYSVIYGPDTIWVPEGNPAPGFKEGGMNSVAMKYDKEGETLKVLINEKEVLSKKLTDDVEIKTSAAGFGFNQGETGSTALADFVVETNEDTDVTAEHTEKTLPNAFFISPTAVLTTNMQLREPKGKQPTLGIVRAEARQEAYFARFEVPIPSDGEWTCWVVTLPRKAYWTSPYRGLIDNQKPTSEGLKQSDEPNSGPRWENLGNWKLDAGKHTLDIVLTDRRTRPDDAFCFSLWKVMMVKNDSLVPEKINLDLDYNPQIFHGQQTKSLGREYADIPTIEKRNNVAILTGSVKETAAIHAPIWRDYAQGGTFSSVEFLHPPLIKALRPRFIRKDHCLDNDALKRNADGTIVYDFSVGLAHIEAILALGAEPIVGLDTFPSALIRGQEVKTLHTDKQFLDEWRDLVTAFAKYVLIEKKLPVQYFQHFNEPEFSGFPDAWDTVIATYITAARALKAVDPKALIGGPGSGEGSSSPLNSVFIDALAKEPELLDFFDFHIYQSTPGYLKTSIESVRDRLTKAGLEKAPVAITEWGASSGLTPDLSDISTVAYNSSTMKALVEESIDIGALFCLIDPWEADYPGQRSNQYGLITQDGHIKPAYWGQWLWSRLPDDGERVIISGEADGIETLAVKKQDKLYVLVWNTRSPGSPLGKAKIRLNDIEKTSAQVDQFLVDDFHSIPSLPAQSAIELKPVSQTKQKIEDGRFTYDVSLEAGALTLLEIQLQ